ncbi:hypothetical protein [Solitalea canadensis]|uniref:Uncharacterized protein n=1 Tax=Solitalea canadensis (strain ATCC 29591 / DSM 3403 / JCM 21819 / LMG 8368 / NBRC 15130 / NCIMB 12057 / USAM 9D) TaxID=929556 RepID=H8KPU1_SOLCM|nr:hypothetical protein [Solitalea canadensis]AFD05989.1 hypothetical protein Solca_0874 [Solitalea canadensis DSM 3403]
MSVEKQKAESYYVSHPNHSFSVFFINEIGDLFITGDWGDYSYTWRRYGNDFKEFLTGLNEEYFCSKISINYNNQHLKSPSKSKLKSVWQLFALLQEELRKETNL